MGLDNIVSTEHVSAMELALRMLNASLDKFASMEHVVLTIAFDKDTQCPFGPCTNGTCSFSNGTCAYDANCMWGQLCINGKCSNGTCTKDDQCNTGNYCNLDTNQCTLRGWVWVIIVIFILLPVGGVCCWLICCCECFYLFCKGLICCCEYAEE